MAEKKEQKPIFIESEELLAVCGKRKPGYDWITEDSDNKDGGFKEVKYSTDTPGNFRRIIIKDFNGEPIAAALIEHPKTDKAKVIMLSLNKDALKTFDTAATRLRDGIEGAGATEEEISGLIGMINTTAEAYASLLIYQAQDGKIKGSLRTESDKIDVSRLAKTFGGGGHRRAAGFSIRGKLVRDKKGWKVE